MIYVDDVEIPFRNMIMSHLMPGPGTSIHELITFGKKIGLRRYCVQLNSDVPHFDVSKSMKARAIKNGAIAISTREQTWSDILAYWRSNRNGGCIDI